MITPVTVNLSAAMHRASLVLDTIERRTKKLNDRDTYPELAKQLEDLVVNLLSASSALSLIGVTPMGARFDFAPDTKLAAKANECVSYLRNDATNLLKDGGSFSPYESTHTDAALGRIKGLYGLLVGAIVSQAHQDITAVSRLSLPRLVAVAATVSEAAAQDGKVDTTLKDQPRGDQYLTPKH